MALFPLPPTRPAHAETRMRAREFSACHPPRTTSALMTMSDFRPLVQLPLPPMKTPHVGGCLSAGLSVLADAARFPATWFLRLGGTPSLVQSIN